MAAPTSQPSADFGGPKITELGMLSIGFVAAGVIDLAAYFPNRAPLGPVVALLALAAGTLAVNLLLLVRQPGFAWARFRQVFGWMAIVYGVIAGMLEYTFIYDHTRGTVLGLMTVFLVLFTINVPLIDGFTVARFENPPAS
ncbi:MAG: hypothetical protein WCH31_00590 [Actinomycetes bacterium]